MDLSRSILKNFANTVSSSEKSDKQMFARGTAKIIGEEKYVQLDGSEYLTPISELSDVQNDDRIFVTIENHTATVLGNFTYPIPRTAIAAKERAESSVKYTELESEVGKFNYVKTDALEAQYATIDNLNATNAKIENLDAKKLSAEQAEITYATIENLKATNATIENLDAKKLSAEQADLNYANIDFANIGEAAINKFYSVSGIIKDLTLESGVVVKELVGVLIRGDRIIGNTIQADKLIVRGEDGLYYKLNVDALGKATASKDEKYKNGLDGSVIIAKSVTAEKVSVSDLVAFGATIGGFNITGVGGYNLLKPSTVSYSSRLQDGVDGVTSSTVGNAVTDWIHVTYGKFYALSYLVNGERYCWKTGDTPVNRINVKKIDGTIEAYDKFPTELETRETNGVAYKIPSSDVVAMRFEFQLIGAGGASQPDISNRDKLTSYKPMIVEGDSASEAISNALTKAYIDGDNPGAIYSGVKSSVDNTTVGICLDSKGQIAIGDADNFIKFYENGNDNYKLEISAESMTFGARKKDLERSVNNLGDSVNSVDEKMLDVTSLLYEVTYNSGDSTYTITDKRISSSDISNVSIVEGKVTTTGEQVYSCTDANSLTVYFAKVQVSTNDLQDALDDTSKRLKEAESFIENLGDKLITTVKDSEGKTSLEQTSSGWTFNLDALNDTVNETKDGVEQAKKDIGDPETGTGLYGETSKLSKKFEDQDEYIKIYKLDGQPYLELGNSSKFKVKITNDEIQFFEGTTKVAYISNQQLYIEKAIIKNEIEIGNNSGFIWTNRDNGNMGLQWFKRSESEITYTISYDANGGSGAPASQTKTRGEDLIISDVQPIKSGYTFMGWSTIQNGNVSYKSGWPCSENRDLILYAVWEKYYTVTFDAKGGTGAPDPITFPSGSGAEIPSEEPKREGFKFMGWDMYSSGNMVYLRPGDTYAADSDQTLYAVWVAESSSTADGSSFDKAITISSGDTITANKTSSNQRVYYKFTPSESGSYTFQSTGASNNLDVDAYLYDSTSDHKQLAYHYDINGTTDRNFKLTYTFTADTTYYFVVLFYDSSSNPGSPTGSINFSVTKGSSSTVYYTITFDANGGSNPPDPITFPRDGSANIPSGEPTREGFTFKGWNTSSNATTASYQSGDLYSTNANITLYAVWELEDSSTADGSSFDKAITISSGDTITATKTSRNQYIYYKFTPSESGSYTFQSTGASNALDADAFLYDSTDHNQLANHADINGATDRNFKLTYHYFTKDTTYYFAVNFWDSSSSTDITTGSINFSVTKESGSSTTTYNIKYYPNNGLNNGNANSYNETKNQGQPYTIRDINYFSVSADGYTFAGWSKSSDSLTASYLPGDSYTTDADLILYAVWYVEESGSGDGSSAGTAYTLTLNSTMVITNIGEGEKKWCKFTPSTTGKYTFTISSSGQCVFVLTDDASGDTYISRFMVPSCTEGTYDLTAGTEYYVMVVSAVANNNVTLTVSDY